MYMLLPRSAGRSIELAQHKVRCGNRVTEIDMAKTPDKVKNDEPAAEATTPGNAESEQQQRQIVVHAQYVKDLSFENPNAPDIRGGKPAI